jgi:thiamine-phosphate pyrophosphorylase
MVIVISNPTSVKDEHVIINQLFEEGLELFHLRKPASSVTELSSLLKNIEIKHYAKIALHQHHEIADQFGLKRVHYTEENRKNIFESDLNKQLQKNNILSSSIHDIEAYKKVSAHFDYVFLGPVFNSISKPGYHSILKNGFQIPVLRKIKIIALGGIDNKKAEDARTYGFDGIAVLGAIWNKPENALINFKNIKEKWQK